MRHLNPARRAARGVTLIELMVGLAIAAILVMAAAPSFSDYIANSRLRENGNLLYVQTLLAQSEAIKRNTVVRLSAAGSTVQVIDRTDPDVPVLLFERTLTNGVTVADGTVDFGGEGRPLGFAAGSINLSMTGVICSTATRCPGLRVDGGGAVRLCNDHTTACD